MQQQHSAEDLAGTMAKSCVATRVGRLHRLVARRFEEHLRPLGLSVPQTEILSALTLIAEPVKPSVLADLLQMERSTISRNLSVMEDRGWITPKETSATGRSMTVVITDQGLATLASADAAWHDAQTELVQAMGHEAASTIDAWLGELTVQGQRPQA
jgi:DNA-binding MarR family transcriptional regulator